MTFVDHIPMMSFPGLGISNLSTLSKGNNYASCASQLRFLNPSEGTGVDRAERHDRVWLARYFVNSRMSSA